MSNKKESFSLESILESEEKYNLCVWKFYQKHFGKLKIVNKYTTIPFHSDHPAYIKQKNVTCNVCKSETFSSQSGSLMKKNWSVY